LSDAGDVLVMLTCETWIAEHQLRPKQAVQVAAIRFRELGRTLGDGLLLPAVLRPVAKVQAGEAAAIRADAGVMLPKAMPAGSITLDQVAAHTAVLAVACSRCDRAGRYHLDALIEKHGPGSAFPSCCA
jgi:hypothetical protein